MQRGEACRRDSAAAAVRADLVEVDTPARDLLSGLCQRLEPVLVQALVAELAIEALDVGVLRRLARLVQDVLDALGPCPRQEGSAGELRPLVGADGLRVA